MDKPATDSVRNAHMIGKNKCKTFSEQCLLINGKHSIYEPIAQNKLSLFHQRKTIKISKTKQELVSLKSDCKLYANLYVACQVRDGNLDAFFSHENHSYPPAISEYGKLRKCSEKSAFLQCLETIESPKFDEPSVDCVIIDGPAFVHMYPPRSSKTFGEYCNELRSKVESIVSLVLRVDFVFDVYKAVSLKSQTRERRGKGVRVAVKGETPIVKNFNDFLRTVENKSELFRMIADAFTSFSCEKTIISTKDDIVISNEIDKPIDLGPCNHEEADTRMFLHVQDASNKGMKKIKVLTVDTDVVVLALYFFHDLFVSELWIEFGTGKNRRWLPIHLYASKLGKEICRAIPFWFAMTGCDTVSMFAGRGKKTCWEAWKAYPEVTETFIRLSVVKQMSDDDWQKIQRFVVLLYDRTSPCNMINECRRYLFTKGRMIHLIPPTEDALKQHIIRAILQSRIWTQALLSEQPAINYEENGWVYSCNTLVPKWMTIPQVYEVCGELIKCRCKTTCIGRCKCKKANLDCTELCLCSGKCVIFNDK